MTVSRRRFLLAGTSSAFAAAAACAHARRSAAVRRPPVPPPAPPTTATPVTTATEPARFVRTGPSTGDAVALTFHGSGDVALTRELLDAAHRAATPLTIFAVGQWLDANPTMSAFIRDAGNELANHTYTHPALGRVGRSGVADEIRRCRAALERHGAGPGRWFRPSGIEVPTPLMLEEAGRAGYATVVGYDVDPHDYQDPGADAVAARVIAGLHAGAIVSLHTGHRGTVDAFPRIVQGIAAAGLRSVTVAQLLQT